LLWILILIGVPIAALLLVIGPWLMELAMEEQCRQNIAAIAFTVLEYRSDHGGQFPPDVATVDSADNFHGGFAHLMKYDGERGFLTSTPGQPDYFFIDWSTRLRGPDYKDSTYPLLYDYRLSNHRGRGINIAMCDGTARWDPGAAWLKQFIAAHPEANLPMPQ
jgi:prepilin-type processing-associated H-X9-DG protein